MNESRAIKLTHVERLILHNQFMILKTLKPDSSYDLQAEVMANGYEAEYEWAMSDVSSEVLCPHDMCMEVRDILQMHMALQKSYETLEDKLGIPKTAIAYAGLSSDETEVCQSYYASFLTENKIMPFRKLLDDPNATGESSVPMMETYRRMLAKWAGFGRRMELTGDEIWEILRAKKINVICKPEVSKRRRKADSD